MDTWFSAQERTTRSSSRLKGGRQEYHESFLPRSMFEDVQSMLSCCRYSLALLMASKFLEKRAQHGSQPKYFAINNELKYVGHCWANQDSWLVAHASTTESNCGGNSLSLSLYYIYMGILGFPQNRDKTRFHGQFVVPACSHKLLAITAITGSTSTNSTSTETNNRIWEAKESGKPRAITCVPAFEITL